MRWIEPVAYALVAPTLQFVEFGELFDIGRFAYGERVLSLQPLAYAVVAAGVLLGWALVALVVRFVSPRSTSRDSAMRRRLVGLFVLWSAVMIVPLYDSREYSANWERVAMLWTVLKVGLGVIMAFVVALIVQRLRARAATA
jgi:hypothetical protein